MGCDLQRPYSASDSAISAPSGHSLWTSNPLLRIGCGLQLPFSASVGAFNPTYGYQMWPSHPLLSNRWGFQCLFWASDVGFNQGTGFVLRFSESSGQKNKIMHCKAIRTRIKLTRKLLSGLANFQINFVSLRALRPLRTL